MVCALPWELLDLLTRSDVAEEMMKGYMKWLKPTLSAHVSWTYLRGR